MYPSIEDQLELMSPSDKALYKKLRFSESIEGWLLAEEVVELYKLTSSIKDRPAIICEIGTWLGKSASILGKAALQHGAMQVFCVDPFTGIGDKASIPSYQEKIKSLPRSLQASCVENLSRVGVSSVIQLLPYTSKEARKKFKAKHINGLFIDGDHSYEAVMEDIKLWTPLITPNGWIALHDVYAKYIEGPKRAFEELVRDNNWRDWKIIGEMAIGRRR